MGGEPYLKEGLWYSISQNHSRILWYDRLSAGLILVITRQCWRQECNWSWYDNLRAWNYERRICLRQCYFKDYTKLTVVVKLTNRFQVAVRLFSNRSQRTSKCGKNISDTLGCASCATFLFLPHFDVLCDLLLNRRTVTWNLFVLYNKELKKSLNDDVIFTSVLQ